LKTVWPERLLEAKVSKNGKKLSVFALARENKGAPWAYKLGTIDEHREAFTKKTKITFED
jgi:hypothetical protein